MRDKCVIQWQKLQREGWRYVPRMLWQRAVWEYGRRFNRSKTETASEAQFHNTAIEAAFRRACERYALPTLPLTVALFRPPLRPTHVFGPERMINGDRRFIYEDNGWSRVVPQVAVEEVPGDHDSMVLEPNVRVLAARLRSLIEKLERGLDVAPRTVQAPMPVTVAMNSPQGVAEPVSV